MNTSTCDGFISQVPRKNFLTRKYWFTIHVENILNFNACYKLEHAAIYNILKKFYLLTVSIVLKIYSEFKIAGIRQRF